MQIKGVGKAGPIVRGNTESELLAYFKRINGTLRRRRKSGAGGSLGAMKTVEYRSTSSNGAGTGGVSDQTV